MFRYLINGLNNVTNVFFKFIHLPFVGMTGLFLLPRKILGVIKDETISGTIKRGLEREGNMSKGWRH